MSKRPFPVEAGHVLTFARSIGDENPVYRDVDYAKDKGFANIIAPPTFTQGAAHFDEEYPGRPQPGQPWIGSGATPTGVVDDGSTNQGTEMHAEQHFEYHRPVMVGDVLTTTTREGETWTKESKRAGTLTFTERIFDYTDQTGALVLTVREVAVRTENPVEG